MKFTDFETKIILYSIPKNGGKPLITIQVRYPRMIHAELMTHRVFSRNARSSRAVPVNKLLQEEIYVPHFMKNQAGMQSFEEFGPGELQEIENAWVEFAEKTQAFSKWLSDKGVHKQWANRPMEWFGYIDVLITSTEWKNFFELRLHPAAMPEIRELAKRMDREIKFLEEYEYNKWQELKPGEWHIPYILDSENDLELNIKLMLSVARCARLSYTPFDGIASLEKEIARHNLLRNANPIHASPFEHQAKICDKSQKTGQEFLETQNYILSNFSYPWIQYRKLVELELNDNI